MSHLLLLHQLQLQPSIDHKVEDSYLGDELYMIIMDEFKQRLEARGRG